MTEHCDRKIGDTVKLKSGEHGEIVEVVPDQLQADGSTATMYGVRLAPWKRVETPYVDAIGQKKVRVSFVHPTTGEERDHEADVLGCVHEKDMG